MKNIIIIIATLISLGYSSSIEAQDIFIQFEGIDGESQDANHNNWSNVSDIGRSALTRPQGSGSSLDQGTITVTITRDKSWVKLLERVNTGAVIPSVKIEHRKNGVTPLVYIKTKLTAAVITAIDYGDDPCCVSVTLRAQMIGDKYTSQTASGGAGTPKTFGWDYATNMSCTSCIPQ